MENSLTAHTIAKWAGYIEQSGLPSIPDKDFEALVLADPTPSKDGLGFLLAHYHAQPFEKRKFFIQDTLPEISTLLWMFREFQRHGVRGNLVDKSHGNPWRPLSLEGLRAHVKAHVEKLSGRVLPIHIQSALKGLLGDIPKTSPFSNRFVTAPEEKAVLSFPDPGAKTLINVGDVKLVQVLSESKKARDAVIYYSKGTKWCTNWEKSRDSFIDRYLEEGSLFFIILRDSPTKYFVHFNDVDFSVHIVNQLDQCGHSLEKLFTLEDLPTFVAPAVEPSELMSTLRKAVIENCFKRDVFPYLAPSMFEGMSEQEQDMLLRTAHKEVARIPQPAQRNIIRINDGERPFSRKWGKALGGFTKEPFLSEALEITRCLTESAHARTRQYLASELAHSVHEYPLQLQSKTLDFLSALSKDACQEVSLFAMQGLIEKLPFLPPANQEKALEILRDGAASHKKYQPLLRSAFEGVSDQLSEPIKSAASQIFMKKKTDPSKDQAASLPPPGRKK